jgi:hypothetical protein
MGRARGWIRAIGGAGAGVAAIGVLLVAVALTGADGSRVETVSSQETPATARHPIQRVERVAATLRPLPRPHAGSAAVRPEPRAPSARRVALVVRAGALAESPPANFEGLGDLGCLAVAVYHEARDQPLLGQRGVAAVILRRAALPRWGETVCEVVQPVQFSFLSPDRAFPPIDEADAWHTALAVAVEALTEGPPPDLGNVDHYHAARVAPAWREEMRKVARIGAHVFYSDPRSLILEQRAEGDRPDSAHPVRAAPPVPRPGAG